MQQFFLELFEYHFNFNKQIIDILKANPEKVSERLISLMSHTFNAHANWNNRIISSGSLVKPWDLVMLDDFEKINKDNYEKSKLILESKGLNEEIHYMLGNGKEFDNTIQDILFQIVNHTTYHRGQIATEFKLCGLDPVSSDWIVYKMQPSKNS